MLKSPISERDIRGLSSRQSLENHTQQSVRSNSRFFKAMKQQSYDEHHLSMPISAIQKVDVSNMPLNQIPFRLTQHPNLPFAITASDNAIYQEFNTKERDRLKQEKIDKFFEETKRRVAKKSKVEKAKNAKAIGDIEAHIKKILSFAIEFSMKTNMIPKSGTNDEYEHIHREVRPGPPTFMDHETNRNFDTHRSTEKQVNVDLSELKTALDRGDGMKKIMNIVDRIVEQRDAIIAKNNTEHRTEQSDHHTKYGEFSPEEIKRHDTPEFDYTNLQSSNMFGIPPNDFKAYVPLFKKLGLLNSDKKLHL